MEIVKFRFSSLMARICSAGLALLGFSCSENQKDIPLMYGTPTGSFKIKGTVTTEDGQAVENATVRVTLPELPSGEYSIETVETDAAGGYKLTGSDHPYTELKVVYLPEEVTLEPDSVVVKLDYKKDSHNDNNWYIGEAEETVDFKLKKQAPAK